MGTEISKLLRIYAKPLVRLIVPLVLQIVREAITSECELPWMFFNCYAKEELLRLRMVEKYGLISGMKDCLFWNNELHILELQGA